MRWHELCVPSIWPAGRKSPPALLRSRGRRRRRPLLPSTSQNVYARAFLARARAHARRSVRASHRQPGRALYSVYPERANQLTVARADVAVFGAPPLSQRHCLAMAPHPLNRRRPTSRAAQRLPEKAPPH
eukprot:363190-Chlamydomonas_euryale.AAC.2